MYHPPTYSLTHSGVDIIGKKSNFDLAFYVPNRLFWIYSSREETQKLFPLSLLFVYIQLANIFSDCGVLLLSMLTIRPG